MPASRIVQFICPNCGDLIELHNVDLNYVEVMIKDVASDLKQGRHNVCALEALKFALVAHLDKGDEVLTIQELPSAQVARLIEEKDNAGTDHPDSQSDSDDEASSEGEG